MPQDWQTYESNRLTEYLSKKNISLIDFESVREALKEVVTVESQFELKIDPDTSMEIEKCGGIKNYRTHILMQYFEILYGHLGNNLKH